LNSLSIVVDFDSIRKEAAILMKILYTSMFLFLTGVSLTGQVKNPAEPVPINQTDPTPTRTPCMMPTTAPSAPQRSRAIANPNNEIKGMTADHAAYLARSVDSDCDGISNYDDNCWEVQSKNLTDSDGDGWGDVCDSISSDLSLRMTASRKRIRVGEKIRFSIVITNHGPTEQALGVHVAALFSRSLRIDSMKIPDAAPDAECDEMDGGLLCDMLPIPVGKSTELRIFATARKGGKARNSVSVENGIGDLYRRNNKAAVNVSIR
jgi:hypothetical protein